LSLDRKAGGADEELSWQAVLLYEWHAPHGPRVASYCPCLATAAAALWSVDTASTEGIRPGMPLAEATALIGARGQGRGAREEKIARASIAREQETHCLRPPVSSFQPALEMADPLADQVALEELAQWCQRYSPTVGLEECPRPESLLLDVTGLEAVFGDEAALARRVVRQLARRGITARVAIADTPSAAWAMAHFAPLEARVWRLETGGYESDFPPASGLQPPACNDEAILRALSVPVIVPAGQTMAALGSLSVEALRLPDETCALLAEVGLRRIEQLSALPRSTLPARFGAEVLEKLDRAAGAAPEAIVARSVPAESEFEHLLEHPTGRRETIELVLSQLITCACESLALQRRGLLRFECRFESEDRSSVGFVVGLYRASAAQRHVAELANLKSERLRFRKEVSAVRLLVLASDRLEMWQQALFEIDDSTGCHAPRELAALVDRLSNRLSSRAVLHPRLFASALPEFACQYQPLASLASSSKTKQPGGTGVSPVQTRFSKAKHWRDASGTHVSDTQAWSSGDRPLYLEPRPVPLTVLSVVPDGPPMQFRLAGRDHRTSRAWGPERIETRWWRSRCVRRDYYQVETGQGQRFWLFRHLNTGQWFLHGEFA
jgi:protein ImuB